MKNSPLRNRDLLFPLDADGDIAGLGTISTTLAAASRRVELLSSGVGPVIPADLLADLASVKGTAAGIGFEAVELIARHVEALLDTAMIAGRITPATLDTIARGIDIMVLLVRDLERQHGGHPAAALEEAIDRLLEDVVRVAAPRPEPPAPRLRIVHRRSTAAPPTAGLERTLNVVTEVGRHAARRLGKSVSVEATGGDVVVAVRLAEAVARPLEQLVRSSVDYGIESPEERVAAGKPETGLVTIQAYVELQYLVLEVADDGIELNVNEVYAHQEDDVEVRCQTSNGIARIFRAGVSGVDDLSGMSDRGVVMEIVRRTIDDLNGFMDVYSEADSGTRIVLRLPLAQPSRA